jgi:hypothetical protein
LSDDLYKPRPLDRNDRRGPAYAQAARCLIQLEIPECDCKPRRTAIMCHAGRHLDYPEACPGLAACKDCPKPACFHVFDSDHDMPIGKWAELLAAYDPEGYGEPPCPPEPSNVMKGHDKAILMAERATRGYALRHPRDLKPTDVAAERLAGRAADKSATAMREQTVIADDHSGRDEEEEEPDADDLDQNGQLYPLARLAMQARQNSQKDREHRR